jgi:hypothetical protein
MSKRTAIAATSVLAVGGSLAVVSSASAASLPVTSSTGPSLTAVLNTAESGLVSAAGGLQQVGDTNAGVDSVDGSASNLTADNVPQIVADFTDTTFEGATPSGNFVAALQTGLGDSTYAADAAALPGAAEAFASVPQLISLSNAAAPSFPAGLFTVDGDVAASSTATVKTSGAPAAVSVTLGTTTAAKGGFVLPSQFSLTFPSNYTINVGLAGNEVPAADEANPTKDKSASPIGTFTLDTPALLDVAGPGQPTTVSGSIYAINVNSASPEDVALELYVPSFGFYDLSSEFTSLAFPLTTTFGEFNIGGGTMEPLPFSSMKISFPASTSPVQATSCSKLGTITAAATDEAAPLASAFGDTTDGFSSSTGKASPVTLASTATKVTNECPIPTKLSASKGSASGISKGKPAFGFKLTDNKDFSSFTVTLPKGFSYSKFSTKDLKVTGGKVSKVSAKGSKLTVTLKSKTKSVTAKLSKGIKETKSAKKDKTVTLKLGASSKTVSLKIKA